jgi:PAS domain S-box-containing protein
MALQKRLRPVVIVWSVLFILFLVTMAFRLVMMQRDAGQQGIGPMYPIVDVLMYLLGGFLVLLPLYGVFSRTVARRTATSGDGAQDAAMPAIMDRDKTEVVIDAFHDVVQRLREKEQELVRLRGEAEARAQVIEGYNENILRSVASGVITFNQDDAITTFNDGAARILNLDRATVVGKTCAQVFGTGSKVAKLLERCSRYGEGITREQFEMDWHHDRRIWLGVSTSQLKDGDGRLIGTTFVFTDLTEVKELQEQVELQERMSVMGEMSAGIAHEFRNFMGTILGAAKLIGKQLAPEDPAHESVRTILHVIADMDHIITQFLDFSRKTELDLKSVPLEPWLTKVVQQVTGPVSHPQVRIICFPKLPDIQMDEILMRQALGNLVQNALEAMPGDGCVTITAGMRSPSGNRREVEVRVSDTGCGMPKDRLGKIFLPFYTTKTKGTGLGLALVHKIVLLHHGRIEVDSQEGKGTTFHIYLPAV